MLRKFDENLGLSSLFVYVCIKKMCVDRLLYCMLPNGGFTFSVLGITCMIYISSNLVWLYKVLIN